MRNYLQLHDYSSSLEAHIAIYHLKGKENLWWEQLKEVKHLNEKKISWKKFEKYFQRKYLSDHYYEIKMQGSFELKLGNMTIE